LQDEQYLELSSFHSLCGCAVDHKRSKRFRCTQPESSARSGIQRAFAFGFLFRTWLLCYSCCSGNQGGLQLQVGGFCNVLHDVAVSAYALQLGRSGTDLGQQGARNRLLRRSLLHRVATTVHLRCAQTSRQADGSRTVIRAARSASIAVNRILKQGSRGHKVVILVSLLGCKPWCMQCDACSKASASTEVEHELPLRYTQQAQSAVLSTMILPIARSLDFDNHCQLACHNAIHDHRQTHTPMHNCTCLHSINRVVMSLF